MGQAWRTWSAAASKNFIYDAAIGGHAYVLIGEALVPSNLEVGLSVR